MLASASVACMILRMLEPPGVQPGKRLELPASLRVGHRPAILPLRAPRLRSPRPAERGEG